MAHVIWRRLESTAFNFLCPCIHDFLCIRLNSRAVTTWVVCVDKVSVFQGPCNGLVWQLQDGCATWVEGVHCMVSILIYLF